MFNKKKSKIATYSTPVDTVRGITPIIKLSGKLEPGSKGNRDVFEIFSDLSNMIDLPKIPSGLIIYDFSELEYTFGDSLGAHFWTLPTLLDGISIVVITNENNQNNLLSLYNFIGQWLPVTFFGSVQEAIDAINTEHLSISSIMEKSAICSQYGKTVQPEDTKTPIAVFGSRQTGKQYITNNKWNKKSDLDWGVVGGPHELGVLIMKASMGERDSKKHCPTKFFLTNEEAVEEGYFVVLPRKGEG